MTGERFRGRVGIQQRVLPDYRAPFLDALAAQCTRGLSVFAGSVRDREMISPASSLDVATWSPADNLHILGGPAYFCYQRGLVRWLGATDPDALILEANWRYLAGPRAIAWMHARGRPAIGWGLGAPRGPAWPLRRRFLRRLDAVIAYSTRGAAEYAAAGVPPDRIYVAPNAVDEPPGRRPRRAPLRRRAARVIFVGRLQRRKRVDHLLYACAAASPSPELCVVGDGPDRDRLVSLARQILPTAIFAGAVRGDGLRGLLDRADLFVLPGTGGLALQQALARGLPAVAARGDGSQEDMVTPRNGWLVPPGDREALRRTLQEALSDPARLEGMGLASHHLARVRFRPSIMRDVFVRALRETVGR